MAWYIDSQCAEIGEAHSDLFLPILNVELQNTIYHT